MKQNRREFLASAVAVGTGISLAGAKMALPITPTDGFGIKIYATRWGFNGSAENFCKQVKAEGYDGVEDWLPGDEGRQNALFEALDKYDLSFASLVGSSGKTAKDHLDSYQKNLKRALDLKPDFVNCHAGRDFFSFDENKQLIHLAIELSKSRGIPIYQETHRRRMLFAAHVCKDFVQSIPDLKITLDISHWCAVAETLLDDQREAVEMTLSRSEHIHARIGHEEGAQVSEPRAPEWQKAKDAHFAWWDAVVARKKSAGEVLTMTPEFGPPNYMWTTPYTRQPVADQWAINVYMMNELRKRYL